ncbi:uncharacterized protein (TIGR01244 family) [Rhodoligotrophos appendicifer]|uniref:bifunctional sulfur transferase/dioxygenase Blh n=1 Tax=Rhodoligotrophos appendicifer TaxID=987056 RepID=UPI00117D4C63|nr:bifunctional sulfur transferase/dioxygenase Blh [Rhodoligotrophos appendicifer]
MSAVRVDERLVVSGQPQLGDFGGFAKDGFAAIINNRPDGEHPSQPGNEAEMDAAKKAGLSYSFVPVTGSSITEADIRGFQSALRKAGGPVIAHCQSGKRSLMLFVLGEVLDGRMGAEEVQGFGRAHGIDLAAASDWLRTWNSQRPRVKGFFDPRTSSIQYVVSDPETQKCAIIDPVLDFDEKSGATGTVSADAILSYVKSEGLEVEWILDTHPHADHFSAAHYLKQKTGAPMAIGDHVVEVQKLWQGIYNWPTLRTDGSQWDRLFSHGEPFKVGSIDARVIFSPGHTLASITYVIGDAAFVHDTIFMPDSGSARADFPGGSARVLWHSIQGILSLPDTTRVFTGHDYQPGGRHPRWESTVGEERRTNPHLAGIDEAGFITLREARDKTLAMPKLILHALQVNIMGGRLPEPEDNGQRYLKFPLNALSGSPW